MFYFNIFLLFWYYLFHVKFLVCFKWGSNSVCICLISTITYYCYFRRLGGLELLTCSHYSYHAFVMKYWESMELEFISKLGETIVMCADCGFQRGNRVLALELGIASNRWYSPYKKKLWHSSWGFPVQFSLQNLTSVDNRWVYWGFLLLYALNGAQRGDKRIFSITKFRVH